MKQLICLLTLGLMFGCSALLAQCPPSGYAATSLGATGTIAASPATGQYQISNNVSISGTISFTGIEVLIDPSFNITIPSGSSLTIDNSHLWGCGGLWGSIRVNNGGTLIIQNNSLIEDANNAVLVNYAQFATVDATIDIRNSIFNKNGVGIAINQFFNTTGTFPFTIIDCIFTSRVIPFTGLSTSAVKSNNGGGILAAPHIDNTTYPTTPIITSGFPVGGIWVQNLGVTTGVNLGTAANTPVYTELAIGSSTASEFNLFDNQQIGIRVINSNFTCRNAVFQNTDLVGGTGINAFTRDGNYRLRVIPFSVAAGLVAGTHNRFYNCRRGIESVNYFEMQVERASFRSLQVANVNGTSNIGDFGYRGVSNRFQLYNILQDTFYNISNPVAFLGTSSPTPLAPGISQYAGEVNVNENIIQPHPALTSITTEYINNAIFLQNIFSVFTTAIQFATNHTLNVLDNQIQETYRGINFEDWGERVSRINRNNITLTLQPAGVLPEQYGIRYFRNQGNPTGAFPPLRLILNNHITGFSTTDPNVTGIIHSQNHELVTRCNRVENTWKGITYRNVGAVLNTFWDNTMEEHQWGYTLENNCVILGQGTITNPSDNRWLGSNWNNPNWKTWANGAIAATSTLFVRNTPAFNPDGFGTGGFPYILNSGITLINNNPASRDCSPTSSVSATYTSPISMFEAIANEEMVYYCNEEVAKFMSEYELYMMIENDPRWRDSSTVLDAFYTAHSSLLFGQLYTIDTTIARGDWTSALSLLSSFTPSSTVEENFKHYYRWCINVQDSTGLSTAQNDSLYNLAIACLGDNGEAVQYAQGLYNFYNDTLVVFSDTCQCEEMEEERLINPKSIPLFSIAPNPTTNNVKLLVSQKEAFIIEIKDISGRTIETSYHQALTGELLLPTKLIAGIYFIQLTNTSTHGQNTQKVIIY